MKINSIAFKQAVETVSKNLPRNPTHEVLNNVRFIIHENQLTLETFDLETKVSTKVAIANEQKEQYDVLLPKEIVEIAKAIDDEEIGINKEGDYLAIIEENGVFRITTKSSEDFPELEKGELTKSIEIESEEFKEAIKSLLFATSSDITKPILTGIHFKGINKGIRVEATNGHLAARNMIKIDESLEEIDLTIPQKGLKIITDLINSDTDEITVSFGENFFPEINIVRFDLGNVSVIARTLEGVYPSVSQIFEESSNNRKISLKFDKQEFCQYLNKLKATSAKKDPVVYFYWALGSDTIQMKNQDTEISNSCFALPVICFSRSKEGDEGKIKTLQFGLNLNYAKAILDEIVKITDSSLYLQAKDGESPLIFDEENGYEALIMPIQVIE